MTKDELWAAYVAKNPQFDQPEASVTLSARGLRKLFEQTWEHAHAKGVSNGRAAEAMERDRAGRAMARDRAAKISNPFESFFGKRGV
jgi:hypothetical protein